MPGIVFRAAFVVLLLLDLCSMARADDGPQKADPIRELQAAAVKQKQSPVGHWGWDAKNYLQWSTHSNRLIPVYTFGTRGAGPGIDLTSYTGEHSPYRKEQSVRALYGHVPPNTISASADYMDQTNIFDLQRAALAAGRRNIILVVFDGMDWQTTRAAAIWNQQRVTYTEDRGTGTHFQEYQAGGTTQFGFMVTSPHNEGTTVSADQQTVDNPGGTIRGGYDARRGGDHPWTPGNDPEYLVARPLTDPGVHAYTDSASSATSMTAGVKTFNDSICIGPTGEKLVTIAHLAQEQGYKIGVVTSVPISHATPAAASAHNVSRDDYQDLTRDLLGLPSISHPDSPLPGVDVLIGGGFGIDRPKDPGQGTNFVPGNAYLTAADLAAIRSQERYVVALRTKGQSGAAILRDAAEQAIAADRRLFGFFGVAGGHLPFATANGDFQPTIGRTKKAETYSAADISENPTLAEMAQSALDTLHAHDNGFWLMVEAGDVDWANHDDNIDNSIGAVNSGDAAVRTITDWVETHSNWDETVMIVTADHGHYLVLERPELLTNGDDSQDHE